MTADHPASGDAPRTSTADPFATRVPTTLPAAPTAAAAAADPLAFNAGDRIDDFEIMALLGRGSFGAVYLARQVSLGRQIALKVSACTGGEGRALARLDHPNIVTVYSQQSRDGLRLLCMQYVPSLALDDLVRLLAPQGASWTGAELLAAIDRAAPAAAGFDPAQLADRTTMAALDHVGAACFLGSRLAAALGHAHRQGVLHRDIKAGNVLVSCYGRPLLVDFNMAASVGPDPGDGEMFGGTLPYMAPEHLAAFDPTDRTAAAAVDQASDQYSLGVLVWQLVLGRLPFPPPDTTQPFPQMLRSMAAERRRPEAIWADPVWREEPQLAAVVRRALEPDPAARWPSCDAIATALRDTIDMRRALAAARRANPLPAWCLRHPFVTLGIAGVLPNLLGSAVNIPYNLLRVVPEEHEAFFLRTVNEYNLLVYPLCIAVLWAVIRPVFLAWHGRLPETPEATRARVLFLPRWAVRLAVLGWLPATIFFPWALRSCALPWSQVAHFHISIAIAGLIALTYSALFVLCAVAWIFYPAFWVDPTDFRTRATREIAPVLAALRYLPFLAGAIPLVGAILLVTASPQTFSDGEYEAFRLLTVLLIALGMAGFQGARWAMARARDALEPFIQPPA